MGYGSYAVQFKYNDLRSKSLINKIGKKIKQGFKIKVNGAQSNKKKIYIYILRMEVK